MFKFKSPRGIAARLSVVMLFVAASVTAGTAAASAADEEIVTLTATMSRIGVDHAVAKANGYDIRVDENGVEYTVKQGLITPMSQETVYGDCGYSFIILQQNSAGGAYVKTGYHVRAWTIGHSWDVGLNPGAGWNMDGGPTGTDWSADRVRTGVNDYATAWVLPGSSATLVDGSVCASGSPTASTYIWG
ncbi:hypothetical protein [Cryobacterium sp. Y82]|uniref:hypothetical protein n=1 Tax=Cryobacterium sp. Y82 TaxID=2045017 RepID=UPI000CE38E09|nr:hypothetical protein [Cryobacterium sp. Y82]